MRREIFSDEHELFREQVHRFVAEEVVPLVPKMNETGVSERDIWRRAGEQGLLGVNLPEEYGGAGADFLYSALGMEELAHARASALQIPLHCDVCVPYLATFGNVDQKQRYLPGTISAAWAATPPVSIVGLPTRTSVAQPVRPSAMTAGGMSALRRMRSLEGCGRWKAREPGPRLLPALDRGRVGSL